MYYVFFFLILLASFVVGTFGFCQIIGSIQNIRVRPPLMTAMTIIIWVAIFIAVWALVHHFLFSYRIAFYIGAGLGLLSSLRAGRIE